MRHIEDFCEHQVAEKVQEITELLGISEEVIWNTFSFVRPGMKEASERLERVLEKIKQGDKEVKHIILTDANDESAIIVNPKKYFFFTRENTKHTLEATTHTYMCRDGKDEQAQRVSETMGEIAELLSISEQFKEWKARQQRKAKGSE